MAQIRNMDATTGQDEALDFELGIPDLSIVVPLFNEEACVEELYRQVLEVVDTRLNSTYEFVFVDDGSTDNSWKIITSLHEKDPQVKGVRFSRNFGHQYAVKAGLDHAVGRAVISMDCDLQDPPSLIEKLHEKWKEGYDIVNTVKRQTKGLGVVRRLVIRAGYWLINLFSDTPVIPGAADFRLIDRKVVEHVKSINEGQLLLRAAINWVGFNPVWIEFTANDRFAGTRKYSFTKLLGLVTSGIMSFSTAPLRVCIYLGVLISGLGFAYALWVLGQWLMEGSVVPGWVTTTLLILMLGGVNLVVLGVIGEYVARIYESTKNRPSYLISSLIE